MMTSQNLDILRLELAFRLEKNCQCIPAPVPVLGLHVPSTHAQLKWARISRAFCIIIKYLMS